MLYAAVDPKRIDPEGNVVGVIGEGDSIRYKAFWFKPSEEWWEAADAALHRGGYVRLGPWVEGSTEFSAPIEFNPY